MIDRFKGRKQKIFIFLGILLVFLCYFNISEIGIFSRWMGQQMLFTEDVYVINTSGCQIPYLNPYDESIKEYLFEPQQLICDKRPPLIISNDTSLAINKEALEAYHITDVNKLNCSYQIFEREDPKGSESDDNVKFTSPIYFTSSVKITAEFVRVKCNYDNTTHTDYHSFVPKKGNFANSERSHGNDDKLNVLIIGIDSVSRLHLHRKMPLTVKYLRENLTAIEFMGYNKVSDNTFPNLIPMLTGYSWLELKDVCWPSYKAKFDNCTFVWQNYSRAGYATSFTEDATDMGLFNYLKKGFSQQPTDYYWKTFNFAAEKEIRHDGNDNLPLCLGARPGYKVLLDYTIKFIKTMKNNKFFSFFWCTTLGHNNYNAPSIADEDYVQLLDNIKNSNVLNKSMLMVVSDHGFRFGSVTSTHQGHMEERLPFLFISLPPWFHSKYKTAVNNLKENARRLTTPFDVYSTLNHMLHPDKLTNDYLRTKNVSNERSISLFLPVPESRTCETADIPAHWCTCQESFPVDKTDVTVSKVAEYTVKYMNFLLEGHNCSTLNLFEITGANLAMSGDIKKSTKLLSYYSVSIRTNPGGGIFDATVSCKKCTGNDFKITGSISRVNKYGHQSHCVDDFILKLYCYCYV